MIQNREIGTMSEMKKFCTPTIVTDDTEKPAIHTMTESERSTQSHTYEKWHGRLKPHERRTPCPHLKV